MDISESDFEEKVIQALRVLDWKVFTGDIQIRPSFQIGSSNRIMPDFVINTIEKRNLFVIEIKQPNIPLNTSFQQQLFSYMRLLKLQYGVLIGQAIQVFYDGDLTNNDNPVLLETIELIKDNPKGLKFVELFSKEEFSFEALELFTINSLKKINRKTEQKNLLLKILSDEYISELIKFIKQDFLSKYDAELIDNVLEDIIISITSKNRTETDKPKIETQNNLNDENLNVRDRTKYIINNSGRRLAKNRFVLELVREYLKKEPSDYATLKNIFRDEYQGSTGVINELDFVITKYANKTNKRHFTGEDEILISKDNVKFVVCTEWSKDNIINIVNLGRDKGFEIQEVVNE